MGLFNQFPFTNFHEMNLDWMINQINENSKNITTTNANLAKTDNNVSVLTNRIDAIPEATTTPSIITVGANGCRFSKISDAVEHAKTYCTPDNRVLIVIAPGNYVDHVNLAPNPGIDMIGYGAVITSDGTPYPECALYTAGKGTFVGLEFVNSTSYSVHVEVQGLTGIKTGNLTFIDCIFRSTNKSGLGVGMGFPMNLICKNCYFITNPGYQCLYIHNRPSADNPCTATFDNCNFALGGAGAALVDDAANMANAGTKAELYLTFTNCTAYLDAQNWMRFRYQNGNDDYPAIKQGTNIKLRGCHGNNIASLSYYDEQQLTVFSQYCKTGNNQYMTVLTTDRLNKSYNINSVASITLAYVTASDPVFSNSGNSSAVTVNMSDTAQDTYTGYTIYKISPTNKQTN